MRRDEATVKVKQSANRRRGGGRRLMAGRSRSEKAVGLATVLFFAMVAASELARGDLRLVLIGLLFAVAGAALARAD